MSNTREFQVFGPPGTSKTTYLTKQIGLAAEKYGIENIMVASFTRTAARELVGRNQDAATVSEHYTATVTEHSGNGISQKPRLMISTRSIHSSGSRKPQPQYRLRTQQLKQVQQRRRSGMTSTTG